MKDKSLIIIGGGAAGMMSAITAKRTHPGLKVTILDRTHTLGRKILVCGAGRCNITNADFSVERYYGASKEFIKSIFDQFDNKDVLKFFDDLGLELYEEPKRGRGKVFPITDQAQTVNEILYSELKSLGVELLPSIEVTKINKNQDKFTLNTNSGKSFQSDYVILSAGGKTYPALGSNGTGYDLAKSLGHKIIEPVPSALPLETEKNEFVHKLQGLKMDAVVTSIIAGKKIKTSTDNVMFTQYGLTGPAILNVSREISIRINREDKHDTELELSFFPDVDQEKEKVRMIDLIKNSDRSIRFLLLGRFKVKFIDATLMKLNIDPNKPARNLNENEIKKLTDFLFHFKIRVTATRGWNEGEFTAGGIESNEIKSGTLESKKVEDLYFAGEVVDVDGDVGGFNLTWAWASGFVAGQLK